jgi:hypothetical protein
VCESFIALGPLVYVIHISDLSKSISDKSWTTMNSDTKLMRYSMK